jgi:hypothetical protein
MTNITESTFGAQPAGWEDLPRIDRLVGRKEILPVIEKLYDIHTWQGAIKFIKTNNLPIRRTPSGRPMFLTHELIGYDHRFQNIITT